MIMITNSWNILYGIFHEVKGKRSKVKGQASRVLVVANTCARACKGV
jgi:hypothetical protein